MNETINILENNVFENNKMNTKKTKQIPELLKLFKIYLSQNYFKFNNEIFIKYEGLTLLPLS